MIVRLGGIIVRKRCGEFFRAGGVRQGDVTGGCDRKAIA